MESVTEESVESYTEQHQAPSLTVRMRQTSYVLPWHLFVYASGTGAEIEIVFHSHVIRIDGAGLEAILDRVADRSLANVKEPSRSARFAMTNENVPQITGITVVENT